MMDGWMSGRDGEISSISGYQVSQCFHVCMTVSYFRFPTWAHHHSASLYGRSGRLNEKMGRWMRGWEDGFVNSVENNSDLDRLITFFR